MKCDYQVFFLYDLILILRLKINLICGMFGNFRGSLKISKLVKIEMEFKYVAVWVDHDS